MKKIFCSAALLAAFGYTGASAQDIYKVEQLSGSDLNGDARYVGMGGAMGALGANISAMGNNPAATGLYRRSDMSITGSLLTAPGNGKDASFLGTNLTKTSLDQMGFVYALNIGNRSLKFVNIGFNYKKSRNFKNLIALDNIPLAQGASQTWQMRDLAAVNNRWLDLESEKDQALTTPLTLLGYNTFLIDPVRNAANGVTDYKTTAAEAYHYGRAQWGSTQQFDFNLSFNFSNQFYFGANLGVYNLEGSSAMQYEEASLREDGTPFLAQNGQRKTYILNLIEDMSGTGVDAQFGFIVRPIADSPFRLGLSVSTPTFYAVNTSSRLLVSSPYDNTNTETQEYKEYTEADSRINNDYRLRTPWKVNFSLGTTFGSNIAFGAEYEISDHTSAQLRYLSNSGYDYYDFDWGAGTKDKALQNELDQYLRDTHTLRVGLEARVAPELYVRGGYNFVSAPLRKEAILNLFTDSPSYAYSTGTDYVNLGDTHRLTCGLGYRGKNFYTDLAYQYQTQGADVYPFSYTKSGVVGRDNDLNGQHINLDRHQVLLTLGYRF